MKMLFLALRNLFRNMRRTIAIVLTVGMGAGALFCFEGFIKGVQEDYRDSTIHSHYGNGQVNTSGYREAAHEEPWKYWINDYLDLEDHLFDQKEVEYVFPRVTVAGMLTHNKVSITGHGQGIIPEDEAEFFHVLNVEAGQPLESFEKGITLGKGLAKALDAHPGSQVKLYVKAANGKIRSETFTVKGIFHTGHVDFDNRAFRIPLDQAQKLIKTKKIETVAIGLKDHQDWSKVATAVENSFPNLEATSFAVLDKVWYQHSMDWLNAQFRVVQIIIISIVLLGIFNTISSSVLERKQEIGNLRANGESIFDVIRLIVYEGFFLGLIGAAVGLGTAFAVAKGFLHQGILMPPGPGQSKQFYISFVFNWKMFLTAAALSLISAVLASIFAGFKVARMPIAKALRSH